MRIVKHLLQLFPNASVLLNITGLAARKLHAHGVRAVVRSGRLFGMLSKFVGERALLLDDIEEAIRSVIVVVIHTYL